MLDLLIRGGRVVTPAGAGDWDVGVQGEKIAAVALPGTLPSEAKRIIDASGKILVPGGIETHTHPAFAPQVTPLGRTVDAAGTAETSLGAIWGGTTTVMDFAGSVEDDLVKAMQKQMGLWKGQAYTDFSAHCNLRRLAPKQRETITQIKDVIAAGFPTFKVFTTHVRPAADVPERLPVDIGRLEAIMRETAKHGGVVACHAEDDDIVQFNLSMAKERGWWNSVQNIHLIHSNLSEDLSTSRVIRVAQWTGAAVYFVHTSAKEAVNNIAEARSHGLPVYGETILLYCSFTADRYKDPDGVMYHTYPSLKFEEDRLRLWDGLVHGDMQIMATDSTITSLKDKVAVTTIDNPMGGNTGIEIRMGLTYSEGVVKQGMSLERYAEVTSTNAAKILGFYPQKGAIAAGSDADIAIMDPSVKKKLTHRDLHVRDYSAWEGWQIQGWPTTVILRGKVMVDGGKLLGKPTDGKLIPRKVNASILQRPGC